MAGLEADQGVKAEIEYAMHCRVFEAKIDM
jgi:hypothetical protein